MAEREKGNPPTPRANVCIVADAQSIGVVPHGSDNRTFDLAFAPSLDNEHFQLEAANGGLRIPDIILHEARIVRIHKERNPSGARKDLTQQLQPFGDKLDAEKCDSGNISARTTEAGYETRI